MRRTPYESVASPKSHSATDPAKFNAVCRSKAKLPNQTDLNASLLPCLTHQSDSVHEWNGVRNGPNLPVFHFFNSKFLGEDFHSDQIPFGTALLAP